MELLMCVSVWFWYAFNGEYITEFLYRAPGAFQYDFDTVLIRKYQIIPLWSSGCISVRFWFTFNKGISQKTLVELWVNFSMMLIHIFMGKHNRIPLWIWSSGCISVWFWYMLDKEIWRNSTIDHLVRKYDRIPLCIFWCISVWFVCSFVGEISHNSSMELRVHFSMILIHIW